MKNEIHTVLGANGAIGKAVIKELEIRQLEIRKVSTKATWVQANLLDKDAAASAIEGSSYVYLCIGLPYSAKVWETQWPKVMQNVMVSFEEFEGDVQVISKGYQHIDCHLIFTSIWVRVSDAR